jgi:hypothetical protein
MSSLQKRKGGEYVQAEELRARVLKVRPRYYISRSDDYEKPVIEDEAELEIEAVIEQVSFRHRKHVEGTMSVSLLSAKRYAPEETNPTMFFGSLTLRGGQRSALAYLPSRPFWHLPRLISHGADLFEFTFTPLQRGFAHLLSVHVTDEPTVQVLASNLGGEQ